MPAEQDSREAPLVVMRCLGCGDTFPTDPNDSVVCPSCGNGSAEPAAEPLL